MHNNVQIMFTIEDVLVFEFEYVSLCFDLDILNTFEFKF